LISVHRNKQLWGEDADEFKPERFEAENFKKIHPYAYLPFAKGPRICIGYKYAMKSQKVILVHFLRRFTLSTTLKLSEVAFELKLLAKVAPGYSVSLQPRHFVSKRTDV
jgi:cytochrome P450